MEKGAEFVSVRVVTDSAATLPADMVDRLGISVVPLRIAIGERSVRDGEIDVAELVAHPTDVSTSGPTPGDFLEAIEPAPAPDGVVIVTVSQQMGAGTFMAAQTAARAAATDVRLVDSQSAAGGQGLVVLAAAVAAAAGTPVDRVVASAAAVAESVQLVATLPNLDQLARSGHVPDAAAWAARFVGLHPILDFRRGRVRPLRPATTAAAANNRMLRRLTTSRTDDASRLHVAALHAMAPDDAADLMAAVVAEHAPATSFVGSFSTAMIVHTGPGVLGLAWHWEAVE